MKDYALCAQYASNLAECRSNIERNWKILSQHPTDQQAQDQLERDIHNLAGSGANFGCDTLSALAAALNQSLQDQSLDNERQLTFIQGEIDQLLAVVDQAIEEVNHDTASSGPSQGISAGSARASVTAPATLTTASPAGDTQDMSPGHTADASTDDKEQRDSHAWPSTSATPTVTKPLYMSKHERPTANNTAVTASSQGRPNAGNTSSPYAQPKHTVYLVEDDPFVAECLLNDLSHLHYDLRVVSDLSALDAAMTENKLSIAVVDVRMPDGKTTHYFMKIKEQYPNLSLIFTSAIDDVRTRLAAVQAGGQYFLKKPVDPMRLMQLLDRFIQPHNKDPERVIIVPDPQTDGEAIASVLRAAGCQVTILETPWRLLSGAEKILPDIILLSHTYPECSGQHLAQALRQEDAFISTPILYLHHPGAHSGEAPISTLSTDGFLPSISAPEALVAQVKEKVEHHRKLVDIIARDSLTGAYTEPAILKQIHRDFQTAYHADTDYTLAIITLDHLSAINEQYGHPVRDRLLCTLTHYLQTNIPTSASIGQYGADAFIVSIPNLNGGDALATLDHLRQTFTERCHITNINKTYTVTAGLADFPTYDSVSELIYYAEQALYHAQRAGRNCVQRL